MGVTEDVQERVRTILGSAWNESKSEEVPNTERVSLTNGAVEIEAAFLYADLAGSTDLQKDYAKSFSAKALRMYLGGSSAIIRHFGGDIKSFDGDRVMGVFTGGRKCNDSVRAAFMINWMVREVMNPLIEERQKNSNRKAWVARHGIGIDVGTTMVARAGVRNSVGETTHNDLIFVGRAPNVAAKLSSLRDDGDGPIVITNEVYSLLAENQKKKLTSGSEVWGSPEFRDIGPYLLTLRHTNYWRHP